MRNCIIEGNEQYIRRSKTPRFFNWISTQFNLFWIIWEGTSEILKSLKETQYNSLITLILNDVFINDNNTILLHLKYLLNLQELRLNKCIYQQKNPSYFLEDLWLPNLKYLENRSYWRT